MEVRFTATVKEANGKSRGLFPYYYEQISKRSKYDSYRLLELDEIKTEIWNTNFPQKILF